MRKLKDEKIRIAKLIRRKRIELYIVDLVILMLLLSSVFQLQTSFGGTKIALIKALAFEGILALLIREIAVSKVNRTGVWKAWVGLIFASIASIYINLNFEWIHYLLVTYQKKSIGFIENPDVLNIIIPKMRQLRRFDILWHVRAFVFSGMLPMMIILATLTREMIYSNIAREEERSLRMLDRLGRKRGGASDSLVESKRNFDPIYDKKKNA